MRRCIEIVLQNEEVEARVEPRIKSTTEMIAKASLGGIELLYVNLQLPNPPNRDAEITIGNLISKDG